MERGIREYNYAATIGQAPSAADSSEYGVDEKEGMVTIGPNQTKIKASQFKKLSWNHYKLATRALVDAVFDKRTQATHNISGKKRLDTRGYQMSLEARLDPDMIDDIVHMIRSKFNVSDQQVRRIISTKCSDTACTRRFKFVQTELVANKHKATGSQQQLSKE